MCVKNSADEMTPLSKYESFKRNNKLNISVYYSRKWCANQMDLKPVPELTTTIAASGQPLNAKVKLNTLAEKLFGKSSVKMKRVELVLIICVILLVLGNFHFILFLGIQIEANLNQSYSFDMAKLLDSHPNHQQSMKLLDSLNITLHHKEVVASQVCSAKRDTLYEHFLHFVWFYIDMLVYFLIPLATMSLSLFLIVSKIKRSNKSYLAYMFDEAYKRNSNIYIKKIKMNNHIVTTLLVINFYFFVSTMPYFLFNILIEARETSIFLETFVNILFYSNSAFSIFFYGLSSFIFRQELYALFATIFNTETRRLSS